MAKFTENLARVTRVGLDLAKTVFQVHGVDAQGEVVVVRKLRRGGVLEFFGGSRRARGGGGVRERAPLGPRDRGAPARGETDPAGDVQRDVGGTRPTRPTRRRFVKRRCGRSSGSCRCARWKTRRTDAPSASRAVGQPAHGAVERAARPLERDRRHRAARRATRLSPEAHCRGGATITADRRVRCGSGRAGAARQASRRARDAIEAIDKELAPRAKADLKAKRLMTVPGIGPVTATAIAATVRDVEAFASGREFAAFLGLTPRQH